MCATAPFFSLYKSTKTLRQSEEKIFIQSRNDTGSALKTTPTRGSETDTAGLKCLTDSHVPATLTRQIRDHVRKTRDDAR